MKSNTCLAADKSINDNDVLYEQKIHALEAIVDKLPVVAIVHELEKLTVKYMSPNGLQILGFSLEQIQDMGEEYHKAFFNPEDIADYSPKVHGLINAADDNKFVTFFSRCDPQEIMIGTGI